MNKLRKVVENLGHSNSSVLHIPLGMVNSYIIKGAKNALIDTGNPGDEKNT